MGVKSRMCVNEIRLIVSDLQKAEQSSLKSKDDRASRPEEDIEKEITCLFPVPVMMLYLLQLRSMLAPVLFQVLFNQCFPRGYPCLTLMNAMKPLHKKEPYHSDRVSHVKRKIFADHFN